jgi:hypothetical protein
MSVSACDRKTEGQATNTLNVFAAPSLTESLRDVGKKFEAAHPDVKVVFNFVAFCDAHVERLTPQDLGYLVSDDGSIPAAAPAAHNKFFSGTARDDDPPPIK